MSYKKGTQEYEAWVLTPEYKEHCKRSSENNSGDKHPMFGKHHTEASRIKMSASNSRHFLGKHHTEETKKLISVANTGRIVSIETRKVLSDIHTGSHRSEQTRERMSIAQSGENNPMFGVTGENHWNWQNGISFEIYPPIFNKWFKKQIRLDYGDKCFFPGCEITTEENGRALDIHHYDYDKTSTNCVPLCRGHNATVNFNRKKWEEYFTMKVSFYWAC